MVLVTETDGGGRSGRVVRLALGSGATVGTVGDGILQWPMGIAVAATGEIVVADGGTKLVHVSLFVLVWWLVGLFFGSLCLCLRVCVVWFSLRTWMVTCVCVWKREVSSFLFFFSLSHSHLLLLLHRSHARGAVAGV